ncbi:hypothetical protein [Pseudooceanicola spongiae]|uniref:LPS export ABC transporter periplasmic protein LptC n=1 Tax=Pseudooceanicola spongiae TaxID=2613965 RepID=A0A7L9WQC0_9RHOB|nr:hypothetical protein [Pseudooceanicola spongiae]QOL82102.1 hypothetical protein F3W81_15460 [Pseudooceanicola spongiae]
MARSARSYSRAVAWLKVILPLSAIGILSTVFLLSRSHDPNASLPYSTIDLRDAARNERVTMPSFSGTNETGDLIAFTADTARPNAANQQEADNVAAKIDLTSGQTITFVGDHGIIDQPIDTATLLGGVVITSSTGYKILTEALDSGMRQVHAESKGPISGDGPPGHFSAGRMTLTSDPATGDAYLVFTEGVKLVYDPGKPQE